MLKLERVYKSRDVNITLREQDRFLTKSLLKALGIAAAIHLFGLLLFQVNLFKIIGSQTQLPSVPVDFAFPSFEQGNVQSQVAKEELYLPIREPNKLKMNLPELHEPAPFSLPSAVEFTIPPFHFKDTDLYPADIFGESSELSPRLSSITVSGPLTENKIIDDGLKGLAIEENPEPFRLFYDVQVDNRSGQIFWFESKDRIESRRQRIAEKILKNIRFAPNLNSFVTKGGIEIILAKGKRDD